MTNFEHTPTPQPNESLPTPNREAELLGTIKAIETPFMEALQRDYGEKRGWRMCGPASITLSRVLSAKTGIPIGRDLQGEHIELTVGIFDPKNDENRLSRMEEQTYIRYYTGDGHVYYIDPIYGLLMQSRQSFSEAIQVEKYKVEEVDQVLIEKHNLYPFDPRHDGLERSKPFAHFKSAEERQMYIDDSIAALNDERATMPQFVADSGRTMSTDWQKTEAIIQEFAPEWQKDQLAVLERMQETLQAMLREQRGGLMSSGAVRPVSRGYESKTELVYHDQKPRLEQWGIGEKKEPTLTFHIEGERFVLKQGEQLQIYKNGMGQKITRQHLEALRSAVNGIEDQAAKDFFTANITQTSVEE